MHHLSNVTRQNVIGCECMCVSIMQHNATEYRSTPMETPMQMHIKMDNTKFMWISMSLVF